MGACQIARGSGDVWRWTGDGGLNLIVINVVMKPTTFLVEIAVAKFYVKRKGYAGEYIRNLLVSHGLLKILLYVLMFFLFSDDVLRNRVRISSDITFHSETYVNS